MERRWFETSLGAVPVWGRFDFRPERPGLLAIRGAFSEPHVLSKLPELLPHADVALVHLPGIHSPPTRELGIAPFAQALQEAARQALPQKRPHVLGLSIGGLVALSMRGCSTIVAVDAPLSTAGLWPMRDWLRQMASGEHAAWIWSVFGVAPDRNEDRDYRSVLDGLDAPTCALLAETPLEPERPVTAMPSLVSEADRRLYGAHARVRVKIAAGAGHNIPRDGSAAMMAVLRMAIPEPSGPLGPVGDRARGEVAAGGVESGALHRRGRDIQPTGEADGPAG